MNISARHVLSIGICLGAGLAGSPAQAQTIVTLDSGFVTGGVAVDGNGNVFVTDAGAGKIDEILASGGYATANTIASGLNFPSGVAVDRSGNVYVTDQNNSAIREIVASGGYTTIKTLGTGFSPIVGAAVDGNGNVFFVDGNAGKVYEALAAGGYVTVNTLAAGNSHFSYPYGIALDGSGNVFVANNNDQTVEEILAAGGYTSVNPFGSGFRDPVGVAVDGSGDVFVSEFYGNAVKEVLAGSSVLFASVLPGSRSVQVGSPATIFATLLNAGPDALDNCQVRLAAVAPSGLSLGYQTTDPASNAPTGTPNTPVSIPGGDKYQTFVLSFQGTAPFTAAAMPLDFGCQESDTVVHAAAIVPGVDTVDLSMSASPVADVIALSATPTSDGIIAVPEGGAAAFAVANAGATDTLTVSVDTGSATLPVTATLCRSNPSTGACLAPPAGTVSLSFAANATPTFSVFLAASGAIPLAPGSSRVFVRFMDASGGLHGSTSVAIQTN